MFLDKNWIEIISSFQWLFKMVSSFVAHFVIWNGGGWIVEGLESVFDRKIGSVFGFLRNHFNGYMDGDVQSNNYNYIPQWNLWKKKRHFKVIWSMSQLIFRNRFNVHIHSHTSPDSSPVPYAWNQHHHWTRRIIIIAVLCPETTMSTIMAFEWNWCSWWRSRRKYRITKMKFMMASNV